MQYIDTNTNPSRIPDDLAPLLQAMLANQQIRYEGQEEPQPVTQALKYEHERQDRRQTSKYTGDNEFVKSVRDFFGFNPLDFQVESWETVDKLAEECRVEGETKGAIFSAPTGFGKTEAFLGPLYQLLREERQESVAIVYPSRALLQDQLGRILKHVHEIKTEYGEQLSVGCYMGNQPWERSDVGQKGFFDSSGSRPRFTLCNCWCGEEESHSFELNGTAKSYVLQCENDSTHSFTDRELVLARRDIVFNSPPDIVLTTLESLENFSHKPHYDLLDQVGTIVLDEVHLYTGLYGAHAAKIIENINEISENPLLWLGSSATIDDPERFGEQIFGLSSSNIDTTEPPESDFDDTHDDYEHYYFMLAPEDGPGVSSMAIQQSMLLGHTMLQNPDGTRSKQLSFIDSISQINQQLDQLSDADTNDELWQFHRNNEFDEDWDSVAAAMGQDFIDEPLELMPVYSDEGFDRERASQSDILLSTSFLEVGIDVGEIKIITQHRTPWNLSSFLQRAGRAARKPGMDAHIAVYLSNLTGDANMFYRADRFLGSDIRTPLNTNNHVVEWMHDRFSEYYDVISEIDRKHFRSDLDKHVTFLEEYLCAELGYDAYYKMIIEPQSFFNDEFAIDVQADRMLSPQVLEDVQGQLQEYRENRPEEIEDIEEYFEMKDGEIIRGTDAIDTFVLKVQDQTLRVINTFDGQVTGYRDKLEEYGEDETELVESLKDELSDAKSRAQNIPNNPSNAVAHFSSLLADLFGLTGNLMQLRNQVNSISEEAIPPVDQERLSELNNTVNQLETLSDDQRLEEHYQVEEQLHYLEAALEEYHNYLDSKGDPYNSLYRIKDLLRGAYYFNLYLQTQGRQLSDEVWFVPPDYYGSAGQFVKIFRENDPRDRPEESIDQIVNTYAPYRSEYQSGSVMHVFVPKTEVTENGVVMDYTSHVTGEERDGILVPESIQLSEVRDQSGENAQEMVRYCPECFQILTGDLDACLRHDESEYGKIHSEPHVSTNVLDRTPEEQAGNLMLADLKAQVSLESVTLEITPGDYYGEEIGVTFDSDAERFSQELQSPDVPLGFTTRTRGLVFDLKPFTADAEEAVGEYIDRYKDLDEYDFEYLAYHTAAHFFMQLVTDISSVSNQRVFYGFDQDEGEVYVFERTEGGQGIVDLVYDELRTNPGSVLESMNRLLYNEQIINERLWANSDFVSDLPVEDAQKEDIRAVVEDYVETPFDEVLDRITDEVIATVDRAHQFATDEGIRNIDSYELKHIIATAQIQGDDEFPTSQLEDHDTDIDDIERVKTAFYSPDIDGCVENLHITECIAAGDQSETLSYIILEALRDHLTETVPTSEAAETMFKHELPPGGELNGKSIFLDF